MGIHAKSRNLYDHFKINIVGSKPNGTCWR